MDVHQHSPFRATAMLSCVRGPSVCLASMPGLMQPVVYSLALYGSPKPLYIHTSRKKACSNVER